MARSGQRLAQACATALDTAVAARSVGRVLARLRYRLVDVFTDRPLSGNPLCVVLDACASEVMQKIAREPNLSETTFPSQTGDASYEMRIFSPTVELPFAGHPSIGLRGCSGRAAGRRSRAARP